MGAILEVLYAVNDLRNSTSNGNHTPLFLMQFSEKQVSLFMAGFLELPLP
jgi:hypothetical protein